MPKGDIATVSPLLLAVGLALPALLSGVVSTRPLDTLAIGIPLKIFTSASLWFVLQSTRSAYAEGAASSPGIEFFLPLIAALVLHEIAGSLVFNSLMAFFSRVSDPSIGGSYMTLLNTLANLGGKWPSSLCLWLLPKLTISSCQRLVNGLASSLDFSCDITSKAAGHSSSVCAEQGGHCAVLWDGYTVASALCLVIGVAYWQLSFRPCIAELKITPHSDWMISSSSSSKKNGKMVTNNDQNGPLFFGNGDKLK